MVFIDEIWKLIGGVGQQAGGGVSVWRYSKLSEATAEAQLQQRRTYPISSGLEDGRYGRAILNNSKTKIILNLEPDEAEYVQGCLEAHPH